MFLRHDEDVRQRPAAGFRVDEVRDQLNALGIKKRKLNAAIQKVNFDTQIAIRGDEMSLSEALDLRKTVNAEIGELSTQLAASAYERVVYKEERDIVEAPERSVRSRCSAPSTTSACCSGNSTAACAPWRTTSWSSSRMNRRT